MTVPSENLERRPSAYSTVSPVLVFPDGKAMEAGKLYEVCYNTHTGHPFVNMICQLLNIRFCPSLLWPCECLHPTTSFFRCTCESTFANLLTRCRKLTGCSRRFPCARSDNGRKFGEAIRYENRNEHIHFDGRDTRNAGVAFRSMFIC
jgi:hypothetical protein